jgi:hypothetical protein
VGRKWRKNVRIWLKRNKPKAIKNNKMSNLPDKETNRKTPKITAKETNRQRSRTKDTKIK